MTLAELRATIVSTISETFDVDAASISDATVAAEIEGWDSLGHTVLMARLSQRLGSGVPAPIAAAASNVGGLVTMLAAHLKVA